MKKILLSIIYFLTAIFSLPAQTLFGIASEGGPNQSGTIFKFKPAENVLTVAKAFSFGVDNGRNPSGSLVQATNGKLYGMTQVGGSEGEGIIFSFVPSDSSLTKLKDFGVTDGSGPYGSLVQATDGKLYGMTRSGGSSNAGVIFSYDPFTFTYTKLKDFDNTNGAYPYGSLIQATDGKLYGMTYPG